MNVNNFLKPEIRFMCRFLNDTCDEDLFKLVDPQKLLSTLRRHSLYPVFYMKWSRHSWSTANSSWTEFTQQLKQLTNNNRYRMMEKTSLLIRLSEKFRKEDIPMISLKGPALAQRLYGDLTMRVSGDLDILIQPVDFYKAVKVLNSAGFTNKYVAKGFTKKQSEYFFKYHRHITFVSESDKTIIELHWQLNHLNNVTNLNNDKIWDKAEYIQLAGQNIRVFKEKDEFLFLVMHGLSHSFYRLQWLYDLELLSKLNNENVWQWYEENSSVNRLIIYAKNLNSLAFNNGLDSSGKISKSIRHFLKRVNAPVSNPIIRNWNDAYGRILLSQNLQEKLKVLSSQLTSPKDWYLLNIHDRFFFLYFLLRPIIVIKRIFSGTEEK